MKPYNAQTLLDLVNAKKYDDAQAYIKTFFFAGKKNIVYFYDEHTGEYVICTRTEARDMIPVDAVVHGARGVHLFNAQAYLSSADFLKDQYTPGIQFGEGPQYEENTNRGYTVKKLNMAKPGICFENVNADRKALQPELDMVYQHILEVWCNKDKKIYEYTLNFLACSIMGRKLRTALDLKCDTERAGRGSILNFIHRHILGERFYKTSSVEQVNQYTKEFEGRCLINLDELPADQSNYRSIGDKLKSLITEPTFDCREMYKQGYAQKNTFNIIITSQNSAVGISQQNHARYMILPISTHRVGDKAYFTKLTKVLKKREIAKLFYEDMKERFETVCQDWNEDEKIDTTAFKERIIESLPKFICWLKDNYALTQASFDRPTTQLFQEYFECYPKDRTSKQRISKLLKKVGVISKKKKVGRGKTANCYSWDGKELYQRFVKNGWIDEELDNVSEAHTTTVSSLDRGVEDPTQDHRVESISIENEELREENDKLLEKIRQLEARLPPPKLIETSEPESSEELTEEDDDEDFLEQAIRHVQEMKRTKPLQRPKTPKNKMLKRKKPKKGPFQTEVEVDSTFRVALGQ